MTTLNLGQDWKAEVDAPNNRLIIEYEPNGTQFEMNENGNLQPLNGDVLDEAGNALVNATEAAGAAPVQDVNGETGSVSVENPITKQDEAETFAESDVTLSTTTSLVDSQSIVLGLAENETTVGPDFQDINGYDDQRGFEINPNSDIAGLTAEIAPTSFDNVTTVYLMDSSGNTVAEKPADNNTVRIEYSMLSGENYYLTADAGSGVTYDANATATPSYPYTGVDLDITAGAFNGDSTTSGAGYNFTEITGLTGATSGSATVEWTAPNDITSWDVATFQRTLDGETVDIDAVYDSPSFSQSFDVSGEDSQPGEVTWNNDGTKMYIIGADSDAVYEYDVSTAYDISTTSFSQSFSVASEDGFSQGMAWNNDGTKMYISGSNTQNIYEYNVSSAFDVSTASLSQSFDVSSETSSTNGVSWNGDGTKMYIPGGANDRIYEYNLSTGFDVSTASLSQSLDVSSEDTNPQGMSWNNDGTKMYMVGNINDTIYEYDLSTAYDISSASLNTSFGVSTEDTAPNGMAWNNDGTKMYMAGEGSAVIYEYNVEEVYSLGFTTAVSNISRGADISSVSSNRNLKFNVTLERTDTANNPTLDAIYRRYEV